MNTPIIKPSLIYLINLACNAKFALIMIITVAALAVAIIVVVWFIAEYEHIGKEKERDVRQYFIKWLKIPTIVLISSLALNLAIPYKQDCYAMLVTSQLTPQNIQSVGNDLKSAVDYIFEKIDELEE